MTWYYDPDKNTVIQEAQKELLLLLQQESPTLFLSSGGSSLQLLNISSNTRFSHELTITVLDDRFSEDPKVNNFSQLTRSSFYKLAEDSGCQFIDTRPLNEKSLAKTASRVDTALKLWHKNNPQGLIIATVGIGPDCHTSGILPYPENPKQFNQLLEDTDSWVIGYDVENKNPHRYRITVTLPFLRKIDYAITLVLGDEKRTVLNKLIEEDGDLASAPARILREMKNVALFTDVNVPHS